MITHKIIVEEETPLYQRENNYPVSRVYNPRDWDGVGQYAFGHIPQNPRMGKLEYAQFLRSLPFKKGDLLVCKLMPKLSYDDYDCALLRDIDELHRWVEYSKETGPLCLVLEDINGNIRPGRAAAKLFTKLEPEQYPKHWREKLIVNV